MVPGILLRLVSPEEKASVQGPLGGVGCVWGPLCARQTSVYIPLGVGVV